MRDHTPPSASRPAAQDQRSRLRARGPLLTATALVATSMCLLPAAGAFAAAAPAGAAASAASPFGAAAASTAAPAAAVSEALTPSEVLASTPWETTSAVDQDGNPVALDNPAVSNFVGWAYYNVNGTFTMYNLDDTPKMHGDWSVSEDGTSRTITARDADGNPLFTRVIPITVLTGDEFTYRVIPDAATPDVYYDIVHTPTDHAEPNPGTPDPGTTDPGTTDPGTTDPGTTDPGTTDPGTTDPGTTNPGTTNPGSTNPGTTDPAPAPSAPGAKTPSALAVTGAGSPAIAGVVGGVLAVLGGAAAFVVRLVRRAA